MSTKQTNPKPKLTRRQAEIRSLKSKINHEENILTANRELLHLVRKHIKIFRPMLSGIKLSISNAEFRRGELRKSLTEKTKAEKTEKPQL